MKQDEPAAINLTCLGAGLDSHQRAFPPAALDPGQFICSKFTNPIERKAKSLKKE